MVKVLTYTGKNGYPFILGVPARDLEDTDIARLSNDQNIPEAEVISQLTAHGLYQVVVDKSPYPVTKTHGKNKSKTIVENNMEVTQDGIRTESVSEVTNQQPGSRTGDCRSCN